MRWHMGLHKEQTLGRINPTGQQQSHGLQNLGTQDLGILVDREGVQVHHTENIVGLLLLRDPVTDGSEIVAQM
jgi:hypothetical protein